MKSSNLKVMLTLAYLNGLLFTKRRPLTLIALISTPFSFLFFIYIFGGAKALTYGAAGGLIFNVVNASLFVITDSVFLRMHLKYEDIIVASPISFLSYVLGIALGDMLFMLPGMAVFLLILILHVSISLWALLLIIFILVMLWAFLVSLSYWISSKMKEEREVWPISMILSVMLTVLPPVFYPFSFLSPLFQTLAMFAPTAMAAYVIYGAVLGVNKYFIPSFIILVLLTAIGMFILSRVGENK